jgi:hypothetical protein
MYTWIPLSSVADLAQLTAHIPSEYGPKAVAKKLADSLSDAVKAVLIETDYTDKDYRSTYYNFYAKKGQRYRPDCVRLHFFDATVSFDQGILRLKSATDDRLSDHYFGFMVLRPTGIGTIGRSVLSPDVRCGATRYVIAADHKVHLLGHTLMIRGFPSMDQHRDVSVCAHASCWSMLRHYSERYPVYREFLTHDITMMAQQFNPGGLVPSKGLGVPQAERIFQAAGTFPLVVARKRNTVIDPTFYRQLAAYVDSGFPLFAAMHKREHAVVVVGYEWRTPVTTAIPGMRYSWDEIESLAVVDDNYLPYIAIPKNGGTLYSADDIDTFIVAFPEKIFYPAEAVERLVPALFKLGAVVGLPPQNETILRYFITTGSALRRFVRKHESEFDAQLLKTIMSLRFAQFVWVVEIATEPQWATNRFFARAIIDATASPRELMPLWLLHTAKEALVFDRETVGLELHAGMRGLSLSDMGHTTFTRMDHNLRPTQTK